MNACPTRPEILDAVNGVGDPARVNEHAATCAECRAVQEGMKAAAGVLARTPYAVPSGGCLSVEQLTAYVRRQVPADQESRVEEHLAGCDSCTDELVSLSEALAAQPGEAPEALRDRVLRLIPQTRRRAVRPVLVPARRSMAPFWGIGAAAAAVLLAIFLFMPDDPPPTPTKRPVTPVVRETPVEAPKPMVVEPKKPFDSAQGREEPKPFPPLAPKEEPKPVVKEEPKPEPPKPTPVPPKPEVPKPVVKEEPKPDPGKTVVKEEPKKPEPEPPKYRAVKLTNVYGALTRPDGQPVKSPAQLKRGDEVQTSARELASFVMDDQVTAMLSHDSAVRVEQQVDGETRVTLLKGTAFFKVEKRPFPFVVAAPQAEAIVMGTSFQVVLEKNASALLVHEGAVRFKNEKGEVLVKVSQRSVARQGEKPSAPARFNVDGEIAWTRRPDLTGNPTKEMFIQHTPGGNKKFAGLVIAAPYSDWETDAGQLARTTSELLDCGMVLGHYYRDRTDKKVWFNIDRGTEGDVRADGTLSLAYPTDRARKITVEYLGHMRFAAGVTGERPVPMFVNLRNHSEKQGGADLEVCEVAYTGWNRKVMTDLKTFYGQLLDKHKPERRMDLRIEGLDDTYDYKGTKRKFLFTESDAESEGYMAPRNTQHAIAIFFNADFMRQAKDLDNYTRIVAEMIEFLSARRK